jgi:hypothetical protein
MHSHFRQSFFAALIPTLAIALWLAHSGRSPACPFCEAPSTTLSEQLQGAQAAVLLRWAGVRRPDINSGLGGATQFEVLDVARDETETLAARQPLNFSLYVSGQPGETYLAFATVSDEKLDWGLPQQISRNCWTYFTQAPPRSAPIEQRLAYAVRFLEHSDTDVAIDAFGELANSKYEDLQKIVDRFPRESLRTWVSSPETTITRRGLYGMMLGLCGSAADAELLQALLLENRLPEGPGIDGVMAGYLLLAGEPGLQKLSAAALGDRNAPISQSLSLINALRFLWDYGQSRVPGAAQKAALRQALDHPQLADVVLIDLARWRDWELMDRLVAGYGQGFWSDRDRKRAIVRFLLTAEKDAPSGAAAPLPDHVAQAGAALAKLRETDPAIVASAERRLFD